MGEIISNNDEMKENHEITRLLWISLLTITIIWYLQYIWRRRYWYTYTYKMPGPFGLPFLGSPWFFTANVYNIISSVISLYNRYPRIFKIWLGPRLFFGVSDPNYCEILLHKYLQKDVLYDKFSSMVGDGLFTARLNNWKKNRKLISPTLNHGLLKGFVEIFYEQSEVLVEQLKKYAGKGEFDVLHTVSNCTLDIICESAMGVKVNAQTTDTKFPSWVDRLLEINFLKVFILIFRWDPFFNLLPLGKEAKHLLKFFHGYTGKVVQEKHRDFQIKKEAKKGGDEVDKGSRRKAFLDYLIEISDEDNTQFSEQQLKDEVNTFIVAGSDTTGTTFCFMLTMLGLHQDLQENMYNEIIDVIGEKNEVRAEHLPDLKCAERFLKETLRLFPVAIFVIREIDRDADLGDYVLPAGTSAVIGILSIHTNEKYWPNPYKFNPDRFLPEEVVKRHPSTYLAFSAGPRNCIGWKYALMELVTMLCVTVRRYKIYTDYKKVQDIQLKANMVIRPKDGFKVYIEER